MRVWWMSYSIAISNQWECDGWVTPLLNLNLHTHADTFKHNPFLFHEMVGKEDIMYSSLIMIKIDIP